MQLPKAIAHTIQFWAIVLRHSAFASSAGEASYCVTAALPGSGGSFINQTHVSYPVVKMTILHRYVAVLLHVVR